MNKRSLRAHRSVAEAPFRILPADHPDVLGEANPTFQAVDKIRARIAKLERFKTNYLAYQADRVEERDHHSVRDVACDIELCEYEMVGLRFALAALGEG